MNKLSLVSLVGALLLLSRAANATSVDAVTDPRPSSQVVDETGTLSPEQIQAIDEAARQGAVGGELVVVVVNSTDGVPPRQWATSLFNRFAIDTKERNRGLLYVAALGDRKAEIVIGDGWPASTTAVTDSIMSDTIVAGFKKGYPRDALVGGANALVRRLLLPEVERVQAERAALEAAAAEDAALKRVVAKVPDPRKVAGAVDPGKVLSAADQKAIAKLRAGAKKDLTLAVVVLSGISHDAQGVARALLAKHPLDDKRGRGVLLVVFADTEIVVLEAGPDLPAAWVEERGREIVNRFKSARRMEARLGPVIVEAASTASTLVADLPAWLEQEAERARVAAAEEVRRQEEQKAQRMEAEAEQRRQLLAADEASKEQEAREAEDKAIFAGGGAGVLGLAAGARLFLRYRRRKCPKCSAQMDRLDEEAEDDHLALSEQREEELGSVNYDIWMCPECSTTVKTRWATILTAYSTCPRCSAKTVATTSRTISTATYSSTGVAEVTRDCKSCAFHSSERRTIPRKQRPSSSSGSRSGGSSSGSRSGGSSSGRGSSGSW